MDINFKVPGINEEQSHTLNLPALLEELGKANIEDDTTTDRALNVQRAAVELDAPRN